MWRTLTEAEELVRWFPLGAQVTPGEGGTMCWSWGDSWSGKSRIDVWEPLRRLRLVEDTRQAFDADGHRIPEAAPAATPSAIEMTLESHHGKTRLRLVHSGFERGAEWDDELDGVTSGWQYELTSLRHYLERHHGRNRHIAWANASSALARADAWSGLLAGFGLTCTDLRANAIFQATPAGESLSGRVLMSLPEREWAGIGIVNELDAGIFRLTAHRAAAPAINLGWWLGGWTAILFASSSSIRRISPAHRPAISTEPFSASTTRTTS